MNVAIEADGAALVVKAQMAFEQEKNL